MFRKKKKLNFDEEMRLTENEKKKPYEKNWQTIRFWLANNLYKTKLLKQ